LERAVHTLRPKPPTIAVSTAVDLLTKKIDASLASMAATPKRHSVSANDWKIIAEKNRRIWFNPGFRLLAKTVYPLAEPIVRAGRQAGIWN
jgi:hypothetical protein